MKALNKETAPKTQRPERIIQFGEGNFLRAFVDWIIYNMNQKTDFNSSVVVVQPIDKGMVDMLNAQDDLYHVNLQGLDKGEVVNSLTMIDVISRALNPYSQNDEFMKLAEQPEMRFVISNTTEAGIAFALQEGFMSGDILLNLDSEDEGEIFIGCAGGIDSVAEFTYKEVEIPAGYFFFKVEVKGLKGGHSGGDIHLGRGNANKILNRFLSRMAARHDLYLCEINGGNLRNAIPREAYTICAVPEDAKHDVRTELNIFTSEMEDELSVVEPDLKLVLESETPRKTAIDQDTTTRLLKALYAAPHGVYAMSQDIPGLVETSTNLASVKMKPNHVIRIETSQRSSILSARNDMANTVRAVFQLAGANVTFGEGYPGWKPNPHSAILEVAVESYKRLFGVDAKVKAIHAGLECGLFLDKYPTLDMISFGPTLTGVHSPDERMLIPTVEKFWKHLLDILAHVPAKK